MDLTTEQAEALHNADAEMLELVDPSTQRHYVLVAREVLEQMRDEADDARHARGWLKATQQGMALAFAEEP